MLKTVRVTIQIGNSDDKLPQTRWLAYVNAMRSQIVERAETHFAGGSNNEARWQNFCWVVACPVDSLESLKVAVECTRRNFGQDSAAFTTGETIFV